jgi:NADH:ubiquinone oxidoreductase subunit 2 (subunit N)
MLCGNLLALRQTRVKRLLAYSSLAHIGYMLFGFGVALYAQQAAGAEGGFFHLINHGLMKGLAFLAAGALVYALQVTPGQHTPLTVADLAGASRRYPVAALALSVAVLGLGGLPPLAGFMSKWQIFAAGFSTHALLVSLLVLFAALNSVLSLAYYAPLVNSLYRLKPSEAVQRGRGIPLTMTAPLVVLGALVLVVGLWPDLMTWLVGPAGTALIAVVGH